MPVPEDVKERYEKLKSEIEEHNYRYYVLANPIISDEEYDKLFKELLELEKKYPELKAPDSPTQRIGGIVLDEFKKVPHSVPMLSLDNTYNEVDILEFHERVLRNLNRSQIDYMSELKIDGVSVALRYSNGILNQGITRGDGITGEDITENIKTILSIPLRLKKQVDIEVRGEIFMPTREFARINAEREKNGLQVFANPRNATAGTLKLLDSKEVAKRKLDSFMYYIIYPENYNLKTQEEALKYLKELGFKTNPHSRKQENISGVIEYWKEWTKKRRELEYDVDGIVVKVNEFELQRALGETVRSPRWAIALKFPSEQKETKLIKIHFQVGSTGIITPVAEFNPIHLEGTTVKRASLHNFEYIKERDIREGDYVLVEKAGGIIPQVIGPVIEKRTGDEKEIVPPEKCPVCGGKVGKIKSDEVAIRCLNPSCPEKLVRVLENFVSRDAMNIQGLGKKLLKRMVDAGLLKDIADIYYLDENKIRSLGKGIGDKTIKNVLTQIEHSKNRELYRLINALGIPNVGTKTSKDLAKHFKTLENLMNANFDELLEVEGIGEDTAQAIINFFSQNEVKLIIQKLKDAGVNFGYQEKEKKGPLSGLLVCQTGALSRMTRQEFAEYVESKGGTFTDNLTKKTNILVVGENPGSKLDKARQYGITILSEEEFFEKY
ncbi:MAG TPA: NAD-dependent DNA ligase LigA [Defluviitoga tunisiensis]|mgnify:FL=1|nr:NAD-dependent DNA ligase LigA [Defluviitoga tunisiensis]HOP24954.1 NAD-dependent DNA ligase LigA [Defluviitoga sp.]MDY0379258.1 NAD-dependent DNA ligase LigA [Defluviitoga tunisiensis]HOB55319.1 NAD-dependent DNA ligase LigA [Defluviitoga tunisiensis]HOK16188.1 NAD-dependent DNA ligase LigA [Defluviitoga tunisiensis]